MNKYIVITGIFVNHVFWGEELSFHNGMRIMEKNSGRSFSIENCEILKTYTGDFYFSEIVNDEVLRICINSSEYRNVYSNYNALKHLVDKFGFRNVIHGSIEHYTNFIGAECLTTLKYETEINILKNKAI